MTETGQELRENNEQIVKLMLILKRQRDEMHYLIQKQEQEKQKIQTDIEKLSFKLTLLTKSLSQRLQARNNYDKTIKEIEGSYRELVSESGKLLGSINKEVEVLEQIMDKKIGTQKSTDGGTSRTSSARSSLQSQREEPNAPQESEGKLPTGYWASEDEQSVKDHRYSEVSKTGSGRIKLSSVPIKPEELGLHRSESERLELEKMEMGDEDDKSGTSSVSLKKSESDVKKTSSQCLQKCGSSDAKRTSSGNLKRSESDAKRTSSGNLKRSDSGEKRTSWSDSKRSSADSKRSASSSLKTNESDVKKTSSGCLKTCESAASGSLKRTESLPKSISSAGSKKSEPDSRRSSDGSKKGAAPKPAAAKHVDVKSLSHNSVLNDPNEGKNNWHSISDTEDKGGRDSEDDDDTDSESTKVSKSKSQSSRCSQLSSCSDNAKARCSSSTSRSIKDDRVQDVEVQSFREAYGRQHTAQTPSLRRNK